MGIQASRVSRFRFLGNALWDRRSRKVSTNSRISAVTAWIFVSASRLFASNLCCVFSLQYFLYAFYTGQQFYKLVSQSIFWLLTSFAKKLRFTTLWVSRGMFTCEMLQVWNHSVLISSLGMGFGHPNCVVVGCPNSGKRLNKWVTK